MALTAVIKGNKLIIEIDMQTPTPSSSGKTLICATSGGNKATDVLLDGRPLTIGLNAYIANR